MLTNFLYVCQSISCLTSLLRLDKCRDIPCSGWYIFLKYRYITCSERVIFLIFLRHSWDIFSSSFALPANAELYIMLPLLTPWLIYSLTPYSLRKKVGNICQYRCHDIWHGASLDTIIKIQEEPIRLTMWGPCLGNKRSKFWLFLLYLSFYLIEIFQIFTQILWENNRIVPCNVELQEPCWGHFGPCLA